MPPVADAGLARAFRHEVCELLSSAAVQRELDAMWRRGGDPDARAVYRLLGERRLLAPDWPETYGGRGGPHGLAVVLADELAAHGVPDSDYVNTVRNGGGLIRYAGTEAQRSRWLPPIAAGTSGVAILYSEPDAGSDLASIRTRAERDGNGWRLRGEKLYNVKTAAADLAICLARTRDAATKYAGLTLFVVALDAPGVTATPVPGLNPEPFYHVRLTDVWVPDASLVGKEGRAWRLLNDALALERTGLDYNVKAKAWLAATFDEAKRLRLPLDGTAGDRLVDLATRIAAGRALAEEVARELADGTPDADRTAMSKFVNSELGPDIARFGLDLLPLDALADRRRGPLSLEWQCREAPGLTLSAGSTEMMLRSIATALGM